MCDLFEKTAFYVEKKLNYDNNDKKEIAYQGRNKHMGCWNYQIFCDDTSSDALDELVESESLITDLERFLDNAIALENNILSLR